MQILNSRQYIYITVNWNHYSDQLGWTLHLVLFTSSRRCGFRVPNAFQRFHFLHSSMLMRWIYTTHSTIQKSFNCQLGWTLHLKLLTLQLRETNAFQRFHFLHSSRQFQWTYRIDISSIFKSFHRMTNWAELSIWNY